MRWIIIGAAAIVGIVVIVVVVVLSSLDSAIQSAVETYGSEITRVDGSLDEVEIETTSGKGALNGLTVGNPPGFETDNAFSLEQIRIRIDMASLTEDPIVIKKIAITGPRVTYELGSDGSNIDAIKQNVDAFVASLGGGGEAEASGGEGPKLVVENLIIRDGEVRVSVTMLEGKTLDTPMPDIHLTDIGKDDGGVTPGEFAEKVIDAISDSVGSAVADVDLGIGEAVDSVKETTSEAMDAIEESAGEVEDLVDQSTEGLGDAIDNMFGD